MLLAIDSSINNTGYAVYKGEILITSGVIKTKGSCDAEKLQYLFHALNNNVLCRSISKAIVEVPGSFSYARSTGRYGKPLNQLSLYKLNMAIGVIMLTLAERGVPIATVQAHVWKARRGKKLDQSIVFSLTGSKKGTDESDAILLGLWHMKGRN